LLQGGKREKKEEYDGIRHIENPVLIGGVEKLLESQKESVLKL